MTKMVTRYRMEAEIFHGQNPALPEPDWAEPNPVEALNGEWVLWEDVKPYAKALELIRDNAIPQGMSPALFAEKVLMSPGEPPASRSVQRRVAAMKGEPAPDFSVCDCPKHPFDCHGHPTKCGCAENRNGDV